MEQLVDFANGQHEELLKQQKQLLQANDHLANNSKSILAAQVIVFFIIVLRIYKDLFLNSVRVVYFYQEAFESKQTNMFAAIDKLFAL